jgi:hypothetical protein
VPGLGERSIQENGREPWMLWTAECYEAPTSGGARHEVMGNKEKDIIQDGVAEARIPCSLQRDKIGTGQVIQAKGHGADHHLSTHGTGDQRRCPHPHLPEGRFARRQGQTYRSIPIFCHRVILRRESAEKPTVTGFSPAEAAWTGLDSRRTLASASYSAANTSFANVEAKYAVIDGSIRGGV